jgi:hypothetical protein
MSSAAPESASAELLPPHDHESDHDSSGDESERFGSFSSVQVLKVEPETATAASLAAPHVVSSPTASKAEVTTANIVPPKSAVEDLRFKIACMPVLRLKVCPVPLQSSDDSSSFFLLLPLYNPTRYFHVFHYNATLL